MREYVAALFLGSTVLVSCVAAPTSVALAQAPSPQAVVDELLAADRAFAAASANTDLVSGISAMFDEDVVMQAPRINFARGKAQAVETLKASPGSATSKAQWTPVRGGVSADGQHGFTFGYLNMSEEGKPDRPGKYVSYWVKRPEGWRVALYKRAPRPEGEISLAVMDPSLPKKLVAPSADTARTEAYRKSLEQAERSFSDEAQKIGIGPAFAKYGRADAMNVGGGPGFTIGAQNIAKEVAGDNTGPTSAYWGPDEGVLVASSGDLGVTWGLIRRHGPVAEGQPAGIPFFTIWRRDSASEPWRYVAE